MSSAVESVAPWLALGAGLAYGALLALWDRLMARLKRWAQAQATPFVFGLRSWSGWGFLGRAARAALSLAVLFALLLSGVLLAPHAGLVPWREASWDRWPAILLVAGWATLGWVWLTWRMRPSEEEARPPSLGASCAEALVSLLDREAALAILRGALMPLLGDVVGLWMAPAVLAALWLLSPAHRPSRARGAESAGATLAWATDWLSTGLYAATGSLWGSLLGRSLCYAGALALRHLRPSRRSSAAG